MTCSVIRPLGASLVFLALVTGCSDHRGRVGGGTENAESRSTKLAHDPPEVFVGKALIPMTPRDLAVGIQIKGKPWKDVTRAMDEIEQKGRNAGDWLEAALHQPLVVEGAISVVFEAVPSEKAISVEEAFGACDGSPQSGEYDLETVRWYPYGKVHVGANGARGSYLVRIGPSTASGWVDGSRTLKFSLSPDLKPVTRQRD